MALYDEELMKEHKTKSKKLKNTLIISIIIVVIAIVSLIIGIYYLVYDPDAITVTINGKENEQASQELYMETDNKGETTIYLPIKKFATYLGYQAFDGEGELSTVSESTDSCNIKSENEAVIFDLDSSIIYKSDKNAENSKYEAYEIEKPIIKKDNILYMSSEDLPMAMSATIQINEEKRKISIYSYDLYINDATTIAEEQGYSSVDESFTNQKAILEDLLVVRTDDNLCGVIRYTTKEEILGAQYDNITYIQQKSAFLIEKAGKVGIMSNEGETKISPKYDSLELIDTKNELYLARQNGLYGVIDSNEKTIIYFEYEQIGIDTAEFTESNLKSGYVILDKIIPVKRNDKWGFFDITGKKITNLEYDNVGCIPSKKESLTYSLLTVDKYKVIVVGKNDKYTFIDLSGKEVLPCVFDDIYMQVDSGNTGYYMTYQEKPYEVTKRLENAGIKKSE